MFTGQTLVHAPHLRGSEFQHLSYASSLCGAGTSVCPVNINLHHHLLHNRRDFTAATPKPGERRQFRLWQKAMLNRRLYSLGGWMMRRGLRVVYGLGLAESIFDPMRAWNRKRAPVPLPKQSFRKLWKKGIR